MKLRTQSALRKLLKCAKITAMVVCITPLLPVVALVWTFALLAGHGLGAGRNHCSKALPGTRSITG